MSLVRVFPAVCACLILSACGDWPDAGLESEQARNAPWPRLLPIGDILNGSADRIAPEDGEALAARAAGLRARAAILRQPVPDDAAFEAMRARLGTI